MNDDKTQNPFRKLIADIRNYLRSVAVTDMSTHFLNHAVVALESSANDIGHLRDTKKQAEEFIDELRGITGAEEGENLVQVISDIVTDRHRLRHAALESIKGPDTNWVDDAVDLANAVRVLPAREHRILARAAEHLINTAPKGGK